MNQTTNAGIDLDKLEAIYEEARLAGRPLNPIAVWNWLEAARRAEPSVAEDERALDASALLEGAMKDTYDWIGECVQAGRQPEKAESDERIVKYIVARAAIASPAVPEGYKLVPIKPTPEMLKAGRGSSGLTPYVWADMLAAAPSPQQGKEGA